MTADRKAVGHFVFYHDRTRLDKVAAGVIDDPRFQFVDLNTLPVPADLRVGDLEEDLNRALLSEYLGLLSVRPGTEVVGMFTYSIPLKFSREWAAQTSLPEIFLPEITFPKIAAARFAPNLIYAPEFNHPQARFAEQIAVVHREFRVGPDTISGFGPYKGSFVVAGDCFREFADWFAPVCRYLVEHVEWRTGGGLNSPFSASGYANKSERDRDIDRIRHGLGGLLERVVAYYFGQRFADADKRLLGRHLAAESR